MSVYKNFEPDDIVRGNPSEVTTGLWTGGTGSLTTLFKGSQTGSTSGQYYWDAYNITTDSSSAEQQFAVAYGHRTGGGHPTLAQSDTSTLATQAVYSAYRNLLLDPGDTQFTFYDSYSSDHIYVINIYRARIKERLDPGNWELSLSGSNGIRTFIDDSGQALGSQYGRSGAVYNVVSGSLSGSLGSTLHSSGSATKGGFGLFYPSLGVIVLSPDAIAETVGFASGSYYGTPGPTGVWAPVTTSQSTPQYNHAALYNSIRIAGDFQARSSETISSTHYFVRLRNKDFNYSNNPTFFDETDGSLDQVTFINDPHVYVTTIGLYNLNNELIAVAKPSQPIAKTFDRELLLRVRLDF